MYSSIIALDLSLTSTGVCLCDNEHNTITTYALKTKLKGLERQAYLTNTLASLIYNFEPELVVLEGLGFNTKNTSKEFIYHLNVEVQLILHNANIPFKLVSPAKLKAFATGNGRADKQMMVDACNSKYGTNYTLKQNDEVDAYLLCKWGETN